MLYCTFGFKENKSYLTIFCIEEKYEKLIVPTFLLVYLLDVVLITASSMIYGYMFLVCNSYEFKKN